MMTLQKVFSTVRRHLLKQNAKSEGPIDGCDPPATRCMYRSPTGLSCAVGCLIPDGLYRREMEGHGASSSITWDALVKAGVVPPMDLDGAMYSSSLALLLRLQSIHDQRPPAEWVYYLNKVAQEHALVVEPEETT